MNKFIAKYYAGVALYLLNKTRTRIKPESISKQMEILFDLYGEDEIENEYFKILEKESKSEIKTNGKVNAYIVDIFNTTTQQKELVDDFCKKSTLKLNKTYISPMESNSEKFYELIKDIRNKAMDVLILSIFSIYAIPDNEFAIIVKLCRQNGINIIEI